jgi:hypothetical protein
MEQPRWVTKQEIARKLEAAAAVRRAALCDLDAAPFRSPVLPEDGTLVVERFHMGAGSGPDMHLLAMRQLTDICAREGIHLEVHAHAAVSNTLRYRVFPKWPDMHRRTIQVTRADSLDPAVYSEDYAEFGQDGSVGIAALLAENFSQPSLGDRIRLEQGLRPFNHSGRSRPSELGIHEYHQRQFLQVAVRSGVPIHIDLGYLEGGNQLVGRDREGEPCALVGRDTLIASRIVLEADMKRKPSDAEVRLAIAKDLGVQPAKLQLIDQLGTYHIGMAAALLGPGRVLLRDPVAEAKLQLRWLDEDGKLGKVSSEDQARLSAPFRATAAAADPFESTQRQLQAAGLKVERVAGVFSYPTAMNFIAGEAGTSPNGGRFVITFGGDPRAEAQYLQRVLALPNGVQRVHLLDGGLADLYVGTHHAGVECLMKAQGKKISLGGTLRRG